ncbi:hypothetical protein [Uliginosibacterium aquaticum]|uniref:tRNA_anti-like n=1 Tax=Uliginosibacterium aquaticum TaxID=2731212 RepID=A0ABX2IEW4_9RHOO|nr:hypothetical protein [Uliginosibacterium aquaticum]NSL55199.1 hypothetical protein [Uliginosibacterium aquaticum]
MQSSRVIACLLLLTLACAAYPASAEDYYDCALFDDRALCKLLNRHPAVKDLPVFAASRVLGLYREREDYAEEVLEDKAVVLSGAVTAVQVQKGRVMVGMGEAGEEQLQLKLFPRHPLASEGGRIASRSAEAVATLLKPGVNAVFQCVGDGLAGRTPVFVDCVFWE